MKFFKLSTIITTVFLLIGCVSNSDFTYSSRSIKKINKDSGYISGVLYDKTVNITTNSPYILVISSLDNSKDYKLKFSTENSVMLSALPEGNYHIKKIYKTVRVTDTYGVSRTTESRISIPNNLKFDFEIVSGKISYMGELTIKQNLLEFILPRAIGSMFNKVVYNNNKLDEITMYLTNSYEEISYEDIIMLY